MRLSVLLSVLLSVVALSSSCPAYADALSAANKAYAKGDVATALRKWLKSDRPEAAFNIGTAAEAGKVGDCDPVRCAAQWYIKAAKAGYVHALTRLAILNFNNEYKEVGLNQFRMAARWNDPVARELLVQMGEGVPEPDLYNAAAEHERRIQTMQTHARQQAALHAQAQLASLIGRLIGCSLGGSCTSAPRGAYSGNHSPVLPYYISPGRLAQSHTYGQTSDVQMQARMRMCPDGTYVSGNCAMAPDGTYVGGTPRMAPDGSYVGGRPHMAPDGSYVGGEGRTILCPDGSYVSGTRCRLAPDGSYVGN